MSTHDFSAASAASFLAERHKSEIELAAEAAWDANFNRLFKLYQETESKLHYELERPDLDLDLTLHTHSNSAPTLSMTIRKKEFPA